MSSSSSSNAVSGPLTGECSGEDPTTGDECSCDDYLASIARPGYCVFCPHRVHNHLLEKPSAAPRPGIVKNLLGSMLSASGSSKGKTLASSITSSSKGKKPVKSTGTIGGNKIFKAANSESNTGLRPKKTKAKAKLQKSDSDVFKVVCVLVLPCSTEFVNGVLSLPAGFIKVPGPAALQTGVLNGLAVVDTDGITISRLASHEEIVERLTELLPLPFTYFDQIQCESGHEQPAWVLVAPHHQRLEVLPFPAPDGAALDFNKGKASQGYRNHTIYIASCDPIGAEYLQEWASPQISAFRNASTSRTQFEDDAVSNSDSSQDLPPTPRLKKCLFLSDNEEEVDEPVKKDRKTTSSSRRSSKRLAGKKAIDLTKDDTPPRQETPEFLRATAPAGGMFGGPSALPNLSPTRSEVDDGSGNPYDQGNIYDFF
ncbi:hypothetical protein C8F01DRAFT_1230755 [Mycena amicta]|nr:hypothetical protein C8F01DRAFT_1230755 [Mycena amicta]